ncbi:MAG: glycosyl hydrolase family 28-related protein [Prosthecobacter sp.]|uniref:glycoside hydrolase family 55 protein n=1 Tax=Prosthecobacter sp. TaxID=1965333 RepID=UPI0038FE396B
MKHAILLLIMITAARAAETPIVFPDESGVINVRDYGAAPDTTTDDTAAIQKALDAFPNGNRIVYLPAGTWMVTDTLRWPKGEGGNGEKRTILQGAGRSLTTLRLPDATAAFANAKPKALIWTGEKPAQRFRNAVRDLTIEIGAGNPMATGLQFNASNQGCIRNVTIRAAKDSGHIGLDMGFTDEIGPLLVRGLEVEGFETGISTKWPVNSNTFEHVTLRGQRKLGWHNYHQMVFVRDLVSENAVTAIYNEKDSWGTVTLVDVKLQGSGATAKTPGVLNQRQMYLRNVDVSCYSLAIDHADKGRDKGDVATAGMIAEDTSHANVSALFREAKDKTFATAGAVKHLPVKETPDIAWGDPAKDWVSLLKHGADPDGKSDSSAALQAAIDSGAKTIFLPASANFRFESEVQIRGPVERIIGLEGRFFTEGGAVWRLVDGKHPRGLPDAPAVILERCNNRSGGHGIAFRHESKRTLIVSSWIGMNVEGEGSGDIFLDDFCGRLNLNQPGQSAWCRQLNTEHSGTMCRNNGGKLWILGMKTEKIGTIIETLNGGITDAAGIFIYSNQGWDENVPAFAITDSTATLCGINERNFNRRPVSFWVRETQKGETRELREMPWVYLSR